MAGVALRQRRPDLHVETAGTLSVDGLVWTAESGVLDYDAKYAVTATAVDRTGLPTALSETIATVAPTNFLSFTVSPAPGSDLEGIAVRTGHHCCQPLMDRFGIPATARASFGPSTRSR